MQPVEGRAVEMAPGAPPELSGEQKRWAFAAAALFLLAIGFLGFSLSTGVMRPFAIGWVALQIFGFVGATKVANGDFAHPLFKAQVMLHVVAVALLVAVIIRAFK
jgi:small multidrug resistance pump